MKYRSELENAFTAMAALTSIALLMHGQTTWGIAVWGAAFLFSTFRPVARNFKFTRTRVFGVFINNRLLLGLAVATWAVNYPFPENAFIWISVGAMLLMTRTEPTVAKRPRVQIFGAVNLNGIHDVPDRPIFRQLYEIGYSITYPLLMAFGAFEVPGFYWLVPVMVVSALFVVVTLERVYRKKRIDACAALVPSAIESLAPEFMLYWDAPKGSQYQLAMWIPHLKELGRPFHVMVRNSASFAQAAAVSDGVPIVLCRTMAEAENTRASTLRAVFYVNNAARNSHMVRFPEYTHIQLLHGDSDKVASRNPVTAMYDKIFVAGQAGIDRYSNHGIDIPRAKFEIVGRPQVTSISVSDGTLKNLDGATVLYTPTWAGYHEDAAYSSMEQAESIVTGLINRGMRVVFRPHPFCYSFVAHRDVISKVHGILLAHSAERAHVFGEEAETVFSLQACFNASDILISDISGVIGDYLYSEKPLILITDRSETQLASEFPVSRAAYITDGDPERVVRLFDSIVRGDTLRPIRLRLKSYYLGGFAAEDYGKHFLNAVEAVLAESRANILDANRVS